MYDIFEQEATTIEQLFNQVKKGDKLAFVMKRDIPHPNRPSENKFLAEQKYVAEVFGSGWVETEDEKLSGTEGKTTHKIEEFIKIIKRGEEFCDSIDCDASFFALVDADGLTVKEALGQGSLRASAESDESEPSVSDEEEAAGDSEPRPHPEHENVFIVWDKEKKREQLVPADGYKWKDPESQDDFTVVLSSESEPAEDAQTESLKDIHEYTPGELLDVAVTGGEGEEGTLRPGAKEAYRHLYYNFFDTFQNLSGDDELASLSNFNLIRAICSIQYPASDASLGKSQELWDGLQKDAEQRWPERGLIDDFTREDPNMDEYGIPYPKVDFSGTNYEGDGGEEQQYIISEIRNEQYKNHSLMEILKNTDIGARDLRDKFLGAGSEEEQEGEAEGAPEEEFIPREPLDPQENEFRVGIGEQCNGPCTPALKIRWKDNDGKPGPDNSWGEMFYGDNDPLGNRAPEKYDLNKFIKKHFGISFVEYWKLCEEDITKDVLVRKADGTVKKGKVKSGGLEEGDVLISAPNFWPIHVALAYEEYDRATTTGGPEGDTEFEMILFHDSAEEASEFNTIRKRLQEEDKLNIKFEAYGAPLNIKKVLSRRMAYGGFGGDEAGNAPTWGRKRLADAAGIIDIALQNPNFGISENAKDLITKVQSYYANPGGGDSSFWKSVDPYLRGPDGNVLYFNYKGHEARMGAQAQYTTEKIASITSGPEEGSVSVPIKPSVSKRAAVTYTLPSTQTIWPDERVPRAPGTDKPLDIGQIYIVPKNSWREKEPSDVDPFSQAERIFFKRIGLKADTKYDTNLNTGQTNFGGYNSYDEEGDAVVLGDDEYSIGGLRNMGPARDPLVKSLYKKIRKLYTTDQGSILYDITPDEIPQDGESPFSITPESLSSQPVTVNNLRDAVDGAEGILSYLDVEREALVNDFKELYSTQGLYGELVEPEIEKINNFKELIIGDDLEPGDGQAPEVGDEGEPFEASDDEYDPTLEVTKESRAAAIEAWKERWGEEVGLYRKLHKKEKEKGEEGDEEVIANLEALIKRWDEELDRIKEIMAMAPRAVDGRPEATRGWEDITQQERRELLKILGIPVPGEEEEEEEGPSVPGEEDDEGYVPAISGPLIGRPTIKRDTDKFIEGILTEAELNDAGYDNILHFYQELDACFRQYRYLVLYDSEMDRVFGKKHKEAFDKLQAAKEEGSCGQELDNPENKLDLEMFEGFDKVRPTNSKRAYAHPVMMNYLEKLTKVGNGEWRIGDISLKGGGKMGGHTSHQTGLDVDVGIPLKDAPKHTILTLAELQKLELDTRPKAQRRKWDYIDATPETIDYEKTLDLLISFMNNRTWMVFLDIVLIRAIAEYIRDNEKQVKLKDKRLLRYSANHEKYEDDGDDGRAGFGPRLEHEDHHMDHFHVRLKYKGSQYATPSELLGKEPEKSKEESVQESKDLSVKDIFKLIGEVLKES